MGKLQYVIYKITFPNGKIYVGKDIGEPGHSLRYFGSWNNEAVESDFPLEALKDFTVSPPYSRNSCAEGCVRLKAL